MKPETEALIRLAAAMSSPNPALLTEAMRHAAGAADRVAAEEVLLQGYLFLGYPAVLRAWAMWRTIAGGSAVAVAPEESRADWAERGAQVCARIYGGAYERLRQNVAGLHPDLERWMVEEGYGKVLGRPGLDLKERELCIVALLAGLLQLAAYREEQLNVLDQEAQRCRTKLLQQPPQRNPGASK